MKLLLDTCTFLWIVLGESRLSQVARDVFADPASEVYLSVVSSWEIAVKFSKGLLPLPEPPHTFVPKLRKTYNVDFLPLDEVSALYTSKLPLHHRDPYDRMLVCQAVVNGMAILTPDPKIAQYTVRVIW